MPAKRQTLAGGTMAIILPFVAGAGLLGATGAAIYTSVPTTTASTATSSVSTKSKSAVRQPEVPAALSRGEIEAAMRLAGIGPDELAVAGVDAGQVSVVVEAGRAFVHDSAAAWRARIYGVHSARSQFNASMKRVQAGLAEFSEAAQLDALESASIQAEASLNDFFADIRTHAGESLTPQQLQILAQLRANKDREVPIQYRAAQLDEAQWVALRDQLAIARTTGNAVDLNGTLSVEQRAAADQAAARVQSVAPAMRAGWNAAWNAQ